MLIKLAGNNHTRQTSPFVPSRYRGDTMIEVLVTVLILAVGVLGVAAMQVTTLQNLNISHSASTAGILTDDFAERMRANDIAALADTYNHTTAPTGSTDCVVNVCTMTQLAGYDMFTWWNSLGASLPGASGQVARVGATRTFSVTVRWDEDRSGSTGTNCPKLSAADLECYQLQVTI